MRAVVQTVTSASVTVDEEIVGSIGAGLLVLLGVTHDDTEVTATAMARKIHGLRILDGELSIAETGEEILLVSQFTLYADTRKGRRPSWSAAAPGPYAEPLITAVATALRSLGASVATGRFGADMRVASVNAGPRTLILDL